MSTYPTVNINHKPDSLLSIANTNIPAKVLISGFSSRGPIQQEIKIVYIEQFFEVFGRPTTDAEYSMYIAVKNALDGGAIVFCFRLPYVEKQSEVELIDNVTYYCNTTEMLSIDNVFNEIQDEDETYLSSAIIDVLGQETYDSAKTYRWHLNKTGADTHQLKISIKNKFQTIFDIDNDVVVVDNKTKHTSLGIVPIFIGGLNTLCVSTRHASVTETFVNNLSVAIKSNITNLDIFSKSQTNLLNNYTVKITANNVYGEILKFNKKMSYVLQQNALSKNHAAIAVVELFLTEKNEIYAKILEFFEGTLDTNETTITSQLFDLINTSSNFINVEFSSLSEQTNNVVNPFDTDIFSSCQFVELPTETNPLNSFGILSNSFNFYAADVPIHKINSDTIFGEENSINAFAIKKRIITTTIDDNIYDYVVFPSVIDSFGSTEDVVEDVKTALNVTYNSAVYSIPDVFNSTNALLFNIDPINIKALMQCAIKYSELNSDITIFLDIPLNTTYKLQAINKNLSESKQISEIISIMSEMIHQSPDNPFNINLATGKCKNIMLLFNHQLLDRFDVPNNNYVIVPPSTLLLYPYCYSEYYRIASPIAGINYAKFFYLSHGGIVSNKQKVIFKTLFNTYLINGLITDNNNHVMPNQQTLCWFKSTSILKQHHAFRVTKYLKTQLKQIARRFLFEPHTVENRTKLKTLIESLLIKYKDNNIIEYYNVICDERNNTANTIDNNEVFINIQIAINGAVIAVNFVITASNNIEISIM